MSDTGSPSSPPLPTIAVINHGSTPNSTVPTELGTPPSEAATYLIHLFPSLDENEAPSLVVGPGSLPTEIPQDLLAALFYEPSGDIFLESYSTTHPVYITSLGHYGAVRSKLRVSTLTPERNDRFYAVLWNDCDISVSGVSTSKLSFVYSSRELMGMAPGFHPPQIQVMHSLPQNLDSFPEQAIRNSTPTQVGDNKVCETPAIKSRHVNPNSSPRRGPQASPSQLGERIQRSRNGLMVGGVPAGTDEFDLTESEDDNDFVPTAPMEVYRSGKIDATARMQTHVRGIAPVADMGTEKTTMLSPPGPSPEDFDLDDTGTPQDSLPAAFRYEEEKRLRTPVRQYGKKQKARTPAARSATVESDNSTVSLAAAQTKSSKRKLTVEYDDETNSDAGEEATKKKRKGKDGSSIEASGVSKAKKSSAKRIADTQEDFLFSTAQEESPTFTPEDKPPRKSARKSTGKATKAKKPTPPKKSDLGNTQYTFTGSDNEDPTGEETTPAPAPKTPKPRSRTSTTKKTPSTSSKKTPTTTSRKKTAPSTPTASVDRDPSSARKLRTTDHYEGSPPRISFSNSNLSENKQILKFIRANNAKTTSSPADPSCNYLIVGPGELKRTPKFIIAVARGISIIEEQWVQDSAAAGYWVDPDPYVPHDPNREKEWGCNLSSALARGRNGDAQVLKGKTVYLTSSLLSHLKAVNSEEGLMGMLKAAGAEHVHKKAPRGEVEEDTLVLGKDDGEKDLVTLEKAGWKVFGTGVVGISVMRGALEDGGEFLVKAGKEPERKKSGRKSMA